MHEHSDVLHAVSSFRNAQTGKTHTPLHRIIIIGRASVRALNDV